MKTIAEIVSQRRSQKAGEQERTALASDFSDTTLGASTAQMRNVNDAFNYLMDHSSQLSAEQQRQLTEKGVKINNLGEIPKPELGITFNNLSKLTTQTMEIEGLEEAFKAIVGHLDQLRATIEAMQIQPPAIHMPDITIPEIHIPPINVPKSSLQVNIPDVHIPPIVVPKAEVAVTFDDRPVRAKLIGVSRTKHPNGQLIAITERYDDGTTRRASGFDSGEVTITYD